MTEFEKLQQIKKEAAVTGAALLTLIIFWCVAGFGMAGIDVSVFYLPLWAVTGTVGVWAFAILMVCVMVKFFFKDMDLTEVEDK